MCALDWPKAPHAAALLTGDKGRTPEALARLTRPGCLPAGVDQERAALRARVDALTAELSAAREGSADLRLRLDHFTGPTGPQARVKQLESALQLVSVLDGCTGCSPACSPSLRVWADLSRICAAQQVPSVPEHVPDSHWQQRVVPLAPTPCLAGDAAC